MVRTLLLFCALTFYEVDSFEFIVDGTNGADSNNGHNPHHAFKTIQRCVDELALSPPGDQCLIREGRYHEEIELQGLIGSVETPYYIKGYFDERPVWDGTIPIQPTHWDFDEETGICSATVEEDIFALLLNDDLLTAARWPNALWSDKTIFNNSYWRPCSKESSYGHIIDDGLAESGINATGTMAILNIGSWETYYRPVLNHEPGTNNFTYNHDMGDIHWSKDYNQFYLEAGLALLDAPGEWVYENNTKTLYMIPPNGICPNPSTTTLRGRTIDYGLSITNATSVTIANMTFLASNVYAFSSHGLHHSDGHIDDITLQSIYFKFPASSHRMLGSTDQPLQTQLMAYSDKSPVGKISVINCTFFGSEGVVITHDGINNYIHNNLFSWNDWTGQSESEKGTIKGWGEDSEISSNTFWYNGGSAGIRDGLSPTVKLNRVVGQCAGKIQNDGSGIQMQVASQPNCIVSHNWIHDSPKLGLRFDGFPSIGTNGYKGFNVIWNTGGLLTKGDNHTVENNLSFDSNEEHDMRVIYRLRHNDAIMNNSTNVINNAAGMVDGGKNSFDGGVWPIAGILENNYFNLDVKTYLSDPDNLDFRPVSGGVLTQGSELIGPYKPGTESLTYWIPGQKLYKASTPIPPNGSYVSYLRDAVMFLGGYTIDQHHFYFGTDEELVKDATMEDDEFMLTLSGEHNMCLLPKLLASTEYFWRIDAQWGGYVYKGDVWSFTTINN